MPASFANRPVSLRIYPDRLVSVAEGHVICTHQRIIERSHRQPGRIIYDWCHYLAVVQRKPGALRNGAPFVEMPEPFRLLQAKMLRQPGGDREMVDILSLVLHHDEQAVLCAVELALEAGVPTKTHVLNLLHRLLDGKLTDQPDVDPPAALPLSKEPEANVARLMMGCGSRKERAMRHDPAGAAIVIMLRSLKMRHAEGVLAARRMAQAVQDLHEQGSPAFEAASR